MIPFPEADLKKLAEYHDGAAKALPERGYLRSVYEARASTCRAAVKTHQELRDRFLEQEMTVRELRAELARITAKVA